MDPADPLAAPFGLQRVRPLSLPLKCPIKILPPNPCVGPAPLSGCMPSCLVTELQLADCLVAALPPQTVRHHVLPVNLSFQSPLDRVYFLSAFIMCL